MLKIKRTTIRIYESKTHKVLHDKTFCYVDDTFILNELKFLTVRYKSYIYELHCSICCEHDFASGFVFCNDVQSREDLVILLTDALKKIDKKERDLMFKDINNRRINTRKEVEKQMSQLYFRRNYNDYIPIGTAARGTDVHTIYAGESHTIHAGKLDIPANMPKITKVIIKYPATIVFFDDNTKVVVKCQEDDIFDPEKGVAIAVMRKVYPKTYGDSLREWCQTNEATIAEAFDKANKSIKNLGKKMK